VGGFDDDRLPQVTEASSLIESWEGLQPFLGSLFRFAGTGLAQSRLARHVSFPTHTAAQPCAFPYRFVSREKGEVATWHWL